MPEANGELINQSRHLGFTRRCARSLTAELGGTFVEDQMGLLDAKKCVLQGELRKHIQQLSPLCMFEGLAAANSNGILWNLPSKTSFKKRSIGHVKR